VWIWVLDGGVAVGEGVWLWMGPSRSAALTWRGGPAAYPADPADGDNPATASTSSIPIGMIIGAGTVIPLST
jgi:hypothetical protein